jgi:hypothetical protein
MARVRDDDPVLPARIAGISTLKPDSNARFLLSA